MERQLSIYGTPLDIQVIMRVVNHRRPAKYGFASIADPEDEGWKEKTWQYSYPFSSCFDREAATITVDKWNEKCKAVGEQYIEEEDAYITIHYYLTEVPFVSDEEIAENTKKQREGKL